MSYHWLFHSYRAKHFFVKFSKPFLGFCFLYLWYQIDFYIVTKNLSWILRGLPSSEVKRPPQGRQMKFGSCFDTKFDVDRESRFFTNYRCTYHPFWQLWLITALLEQTLVDFQGFYFIRNYNIIDFSEITFYKAHAKSRVCC